MRTQPRRIQCYILELNCVEDFRFFFFFLFLPVKLQSWLNAAVGGASKVACKEDRLDSASSLFGKNSRLLEILEWAAEQGFMDMQYSLGVFRILQRVNQLSYEYHCWSDIHLNFIFGLRYCEFKSATIKRETRE